jgi:hypothetical protein
VQLSGLIEGVDDRLASALADLSALRAKAAEVERTGLAASQELTAIAADQSRVRSNLSSVPPESELARRYLSLLAEQEDLVEAAKDAQAAAASDKKAAEALIREAVRKLSE